MTDRADRVVDRLLVGSAPRADAHRNLRKLVEAAETAVAEVGTDVAAHEIAARAGLGIGTFYRRVGSREALLEAVLVETVEDIVALAEDALTDHDSWRALRGFAFGYVELRQASCGLSAALGGDTSPRLEPQLAWLRGALQRLVDRARQQGALRDDVDGRDVAFLLASVTPDQHTLGLHAGADQWRRTLAVLLDGLARSAGDALPAIVTRRC